MTPKTGLNAADMAVATAAWSATIGALNR
jgi:hypothetical protein